MPRKRKIPTPVPGLVFRHRKVVEVTSAAVTYVINRRGQWSSEKWVHPSLWDVICMSDPVQLDRKHPPKPLAERNQYSTDITVNGISKTRTEWAVAIGYISADGFYRAAKKRRDTEGISITEAYGRIIQERQESRREREGVLQECGAGAVAH